MPQGRRHNDSIDSYEEPTDTMQSERLTVMGTQFGKSLAVGIKKRVTRRATLMGFVKQTNKATEDEVRDIIN